MYEVHFRGTAKTAGMYGEGGCMTTEQEYTACMDELHYRDRLYTTPGDLEYTALIRKVLERAWVNWCELYYPNNSHADTISTCHDALCKQGENDE